MSQEKELNLSQADRALLDSMKRFPMLDKGSQQRLRARIDARRKASKDFNAAFGTSLASIGGAKPIAPQESIFGSVADVLLHPIDAIKGKVAHTMLKRRNKAPEIVLHPDPRLKQVAEAWDFEKDSKEELIAIVRKMGAALRDTTYGDKLGIAAPQIGISKRIFVCKGAVCVNPTWQPPSHEQIEESIEGCYSVPKKLFTVKRSKYGWATFYSVDGIKREFKLKGLDAIIYQHELDHLDGKCCIDIGVEYTPQEHLDAMKAEGKA